jgi:hypothetical protein
VQGRSSAPPLNPLPNPLFPPQTFLRSYQPKSNVRNLTDTTLDGHYRAAALRAVTAQDALGWFVACGYNFI